MTGAEVGMVSTADDVFHAVLVDRSMAAETQASVHVAVVLAVEENDRGEDREVAEHARPPQVPTTAAVDHAEEGQKVIDVPHERKIAAADGDAGATRDALASRVPSLRHLPRHSSVLQRAVEKLLVDSRVEALVLSGSLARGTPDAWSDVDLYVVAGDAEFEELFAERAELAATLGDVLAQFTVPGHGPGSSDQIVLYDGLVKLDLMYYRSTAVVPDRKWVGAIVLKDVHDRMSRLQQESRTVAVAAPDDEDLLALDQKFWTWCWYTFGKIQRGEHWEAHDALHQVRSALLPMLFAVHGQDDEGYRRLESKLPAEMVRLRRTLATLGADSQLDALQAEVALFVELRDALFAKRGLTANTAAEDAVRAATRR